MFSNFLYLRNLLFCKMDSSTRPRQDVDRHLSHLPLWKKSLEQLKGCNILPVLAEFGHDNATIDEEIIGVRSDYFIVLVWPPKLCYVGFLAINYGYRTAPCIFGDCENIVSGVIDLNRDGMRI